MLVLLFALLLKVSAGNDVEVQFDHTLSITSPGRVELSGTIDGDSPTILWSAFEAPPNSLSIENPTTKTPRVSIYKTGTYTIQLVVKDTTGTQTDTVQIRATEKPVNSVVRVLRRMVGASAAVTTEIPQVMALTSEPDFHLMRDSPAIGKAICLPEVPVDFAGVPRPNRAPNTLFPGDTGCDIGAFQFVGEDTPLAPPTSLRQSCDGSLVTLSWAAVPGADYYYLRASDAKNEDWPVYEDQLVGEMFSARVTPGVIYGWWVHAANVRQGIGPSTPGSSFVCAANDDTTPPTVVIGTAISG